MSACIVCKTITTKYKCPRCFERYCSVSCCRTHKELCSQSQQAGDDSKHLSPAAGEFSNARPAESQAYMVYQNGLNDDDDDSADKVPEELLHSLGKSSELKCMLDNSHLRAMMENLVNTDRPEQAIAGAMQEPIFTEFADVCLQIVDSNNPNLEKEGVS